MKKEILIAGGGIRGLVAGWECHKAGIPFQIWEKHKTAGGAVQTHQNENYLWEAGPNTLMHKPAEMGNLLEELGLANRIVRPQSVAKKRYIWQRGNAQALPRGVVDFFINPFLSVKAKWFLVREPWREKGSTAEESLASFAERRLGQEVLTWLVDPFVSGIYAGDPERLALKHAFPKLYEWESQEGSLFKGMKKSRSSAMGKAEMLSFPQGLGEIPARLSELLEKHIFLGREIRAIRQGEGSGFSVTTSDEHREDFDKIFLTAPAYALPKLGWEGDLQEKMSIFGEVEYPPVVSLFIAFKKQEVSHPLDGFGLLVPSVEKRKILGVLFSSSLFAGRCPDDEVCLTVFLGGRKQPEMIDLSEDRLREVVCEELKDILGVTGTPTFYHLTRWTKAIPQYEIGHERFVVAAQEIEKNHPKIAIASNFLGGISLGQSVQFARQKISAWNKATP